MIPFQTASHQRIRHTTEIMQLGSEHGWNWTRVEKREGDTKVEMAIFNIDVTKTVSATI